MNLKKHLRVSTRSAHAHLSSIGTKESDFFLIYPITSIKNAIIRVECVSDSNEKMHKLSNVIKTRYKLHKNKQYLPTSNRLISLFLSTSVVETFQKATYSS